MTTTSVQVVCPVFREEQSIEAFHLRMWSVLRELPEQYTVEVVYVIDPGGDRTEEVVRELVLNTPGTSAVVMSNRFGHQMALVAGMDLSNADVLITMDSDLQHPPEVIPRLLEKHAEGYDVVQTVRTATENQNPVRRAISSSFYRLMNRLSDTEIVRGGADFRLLSRRVVEVFQRDVRERNQFVRGLIPWVGFRSCRLEFEASDRHAGESKYSLTRSLRLATDGLVSFSKVPLRLGVTIGLFFAGVAFAYALATLVVWLTVGSSPSGWTSLAMLVAGFSGVLLAFMGVLGLYIGAIFDEVKARPHYIVAERMHSR